MTIWDDRILEFARNWDSVSPKGLHETGYFSIQRQQITRRLSKLADRGLLKRLGPGVYVITERGEGYLEGEISTREGEPDEVPDVSSSTATDDATGTNGV